MVDYSSCTTHISNTMQGFLPIQTINPNEKYVFMGNQVKAPVEAIGSYCLILDTGHHLDLFQTLYVPSVTRDLVSLSKLDTIGHSFKFGNECLVCLNINTSLVLVFYMMVYTN